MRPGIKIISCRPKALRCGGVTNSGTLLATGAASFFATSFANTGTVQSGAALDVDATGAISSTGTSAKILTTGTNQALTLTGASLTNDGTLQSSEALTGLNLTAAQQTSSGSDGSVDAMAIGGKNGTEDGKDTRARHAAVGVAAGVDKSDTQTGATIKPGGTVNLTSGRDTALVVTEVQEHRDVNVTAGGKMEQKATESSSSPVQPKLRKARATKPSNPSRRPPRQPVPTRIRKRRPRRPATKKLRKTSRTALSRGHGSEREERQLKAGHQNEVHRRRHRDDTVRNPASSAKQSMTAVAATRIAVAHAP